MILHDRNGKVNECRNNIVKRVEELYKEKEKEKVISYKVPPINP